MLDIRVHNRFESVRKRSRGFAIGLIMIGAVVAIGAMVSLVVQFSDLLSDSIIYLSTEIPKFDYRIVDGQEVGNAAFVKYSQLRLVWGGLMGLGIGILLFLFSWNIYKNIDHAVLFYIFSVCIRV